MSGFNAVVGSDGRKKAAVVSHERSGTHFLMNTLALNLGYVASPWWNFDFTLGLNFHAAEGLRRYFAQARGRSVLNVLKSHHDVGFFRPFLEELTDEFHLFYVCRDPRDTLASFWRLVAGLSWDEGPRADTAGDFVRAAPRGALTRYQKDQLPSMTHRWVRHVEGWLDAADDLGPERIRVVRYEDLHQHFDETVNDLAGWCGLPAPGAPVRPTTEQNVIGSGAGRVGTGRDLLGEEGEAYVVEIAGETMARAGWQERPRLAGTGESGHHRSLTAARIRPATSLK